MIIKILIIPIITKLLVDIHHKRSQMLLHPILHTEIILHTFILKTIVNPPRPPLPMLLPFLLQLQLQQPLLVLLVRLYRHINYHHNNNYLHHHLHIIKNIYLVIKKNNNYLCIFKSFDLHSNIDKRDICFFFLASIRPTYSRDLSFIFCLN